MPIHEWETYKIEVKSYTRARYLWMTLAFRVMINGSVVFESSRKIEGLNSKKVFKHEEQNKVIKGELVTLLPISPLGTRYKLHIDDIEVAAGNVRADYWEKIGTDLD